MFHNITFWQYDLLINRSNQSAVIIFHQSATDDTRENLDFAVEAELCINVYGRVWLYTGFPLRLENLEKWEDIFQSGKSQGIFNRLEK